MRKVPEEGIEYFDRDGKKIPEKKSNVNKNDVTPDKKPTIAPFTPAAKYSDFDFPSSDELEELSTEEEPGKFKSSTAPALRASGLK